MNLCQKMMFSGVISTVSFASDWHEQFRKYANEYYENEYDKAIERLPDDFCELYSNVDPQSFHDWQLGEFKILPNRDVFMMVYNLGPEIDGIEMCFHDVHPFTAMYGHDYFPTYEDDQSTDIMYFLFERAPKSKKRLTLTVLLSVSMIISFTFQTVTHKTIGTDYENSPEAD